MKPVRTFIQQNGIRASIKIQKPIHKLTKGKIAKSSFISAINMPFIGTDVKVIKENETSTFIAKFNPDGTYSNEDFKILTFTDLHMDDDFDINNKTLQLVVDNIVAEKPDLVIFTGDCICGKYQQIDAIQFGQMMENLGVYWAFVFGNHEARAEKEFFKYLIFKSVSDFPHCLSKFGDPALFGYGNFIINIMDSEKELRQSLVLFDSGRDFCEPHITNDKVPFTEEDGYDYIKPSQIEWYKNEITALKKEYNKAPSMLYMHIPIPEYNDVFKPEKEADGSFAPSGKAEILYGVQYENVGSSKYNSHLFDAMKEMGANAIFAGHDHVNDWAAKYEGIWLVYTQSGGYNCYGMGDYNNTFHWDEKDWLQGSTLTTIKPDGSITLEQKKNSRFLK